MINPVEHLLTSTRPENAVRDEHTALHYAEMAGAINTLDILFARYDFSGSQCIFIKVRNDVGHALMMAYFLVRKINCFLGAPGTEAPFFCDWIVTCKRNDKSEFALPDCWEVVRNSQHVKSDVIIPGSGKVFFASSGTTGIPKFIMHQSGCLLQNSGAIADRFSFGPDKKILVPVPVNHMYGFGAGFLPAVMMGAGCYLINKNNIIKLLTGINHFKPDIVLLTPAVCKMMLMLKKDLSVNPLYITAGDKINETVYMAFEQRFGTLINLYGCTELGAIAVSGEAAGGQRSEGVIRPLRNVSIRVGDTAMPEIQCKHEAGFEAYIDEYGEEVFNARGDWFATKDMGLDLGNNTFKITGRADHCINRLGFLVSFREIEHTIENLFSDLREVIVVRDNKENLLGDQLIAFCQVVNDEAPHPEMLKKACHEKMPRHLVPDEFHFVRELPRLANGKPDRQSLSKTIVQ